MPLPAVIQDSIDPFVFHWKYGGRSLPIKLLQAARKRLWYTSEKRAYVFPVEQIHRLPHPRLLRRDRFEDLALYERTGTTQLPADAYRELASARRERGEHLYTLVEGDRLLHYGWLAPRHLQERDEALGQVHFAPAGSAALFDFYTHPLARGRGLYFKAICQLLHDVPATRARQVFIYVYADNGPSRHVIEKVGFRYLGSMVSEARLSTQRRYSVSMGGDFRTALLA
jgi:RimJ/RimL family protein N-acetyltransferase